MCLRGNWSVKAAFCIITCDFSLSLVTVKQPSALGGQQGGSKTQRVALKIASNCGGVTALSVRPLVAFGGSLTGLNAGQMQRSGVQRVRRSLVSSSQQLPRHRSAFNCPSAYLTDIFKALMMNSLADNPQLRLIQTRCVRVFHVSELHFHHGKILKTCALISNSLEFWPVGCLRRSDPRWPGAPLVPYLLCVSVRRPAPGARHH